MSAGGRLSLWTAFLLPAPFVPPAPAQKKPAPAAATISSTRSHVPTHHGAEESTPTRSLSEALPQRSVLGRALRPIHYRDLDTLPASFAPRRERSSLGSNPAATSHILAAHPRHRSDQAHRPVSDALGGHRDLARYRIRFAQRPVRAPRAPLVFLLPAQPHG